MVWKHETTSPHPTPKTTWDEKATQIYGLNLICTSQWQFQNKTKIMIIGGVCEIPQQLTMFSAFRLIVNFLGRSEPMSTDFRIFKDGLDIFTYSKQTYFVCSHLYVSIKYEMLNVRIKFHPGGFMTSRSVHKQPQRIPQTSHQQKYITWVTCF